MLGQVDQFGSLADAANGSFLNRFTPTHQSDNAAIVVRIHFAVQQVDAIHLHGFDNGIHLGLVAAFGKIRNAFNQR